MAEDAPQGDGAQETPRAGAAPAALRRPALSTRLCADRGGPFEFEIHDDPQALEDALRGFDFHYVGLLWLSDLVWRDGRWRVNLEHVHESAWRLPMAAARNGRGQAKEDGTAEVIRRLQRGYRILLSRAMQGTLVWFEDAETRDHVERMLVG